MRTFVQLHLVLSDPLQLVYLALAPASQASAEIGPAAVIPSHTLTLTSVRNRISTYAVVAILSESSKPLHRERQVRS